MTRPADDTIAKKNLDITEVRRVAADAAMKVPHILRVYTREEAQSVSDQLSPRVVARAWEYYAAVAKRRPLGA